MLILSRNEGDVIHIGDGVRIVVLSCDRKGVRLGIDAPRDAFHAVEKRLYLGQQFVATLRVGDVNVRRAAERFKALGLPGQLFINVTADTLLAARTHVGRLAQELRELGLPTSRIVIELTETRPIDDLAQLGGTLAALRAHGFRIALDDLGEGFASLRRWMEMRPDFVKIDRHFIDGIAQEPLKQQFVRSIVEMAARLPEPLKINGNKRKFLLKEIVHDYVPKELMDRTNEDVLVHILVIQIRNMQDQKKEDKGGRQKTIPTIGQKL
mgnify:CR=1 FL=1